MAFWKFCCQVVPVQLWHCILLSVQSRHVSTRCSTDMRQNDLLVIVTVESAFTGTSLAAVPDER